MINFVEHEDWGYRSRTIENAKADVTIAFAVNFYSPGEILTKKSVESAGKIYIPVNVTEGLDSSDGVIDYIMGHISAEEITLNIAGNGISTLKKQYSQLDLDSYVYEILEKLKSRVKITSVTSGGQTGFDEAGAKAADKLDLPTRVLAPKGWTFRPLGGDIRSEKLFKARFTNIN